MDELKTVAEVVSAALRKRMKNPWVVSRMRAAKPVCGLPNCAGCRLVDEVFIAPTEHENSEQERYP